MRNVLIGFVSLYLIACGDIKPQTASTYFSLDSLLTNQQELLVSKRASLFKTVYSANDSTTSNIVPDSLGWANEFQIIRELNINKPALVGRYSIINKEDDNSNLDIMRYEAKSSDLEIDYFELYYLNDLNDIKVIKAGSSASNSIFKSSKTIEIDLDHIGNELHIKSYKINGYQKMILQDSVQFKVEGKINY